MRHKLGMLAHGKVDPDRLDALVELQEEVIEKAAKAPALTAMQAADREDELGDWMDQHGVTGAWDLAPVFAQMRQAGKVSRAPVRESFGDGQGLRYALYALFGATAGLGCVWYTGQFYALYFLQSVLNVDFLTANVCVAVALAIGTPLIVVSGALSDRIGTRRPIVRGYRYRRHRADRAAPPDPPAQ